MDLFNSEPLLQFPVTSYLINRDSKQSLRIVKLSCYWNDTEHSYVISRVTGILYMKQTTQPDIFIRKGKANRTVTEQARLEYNSRLKEYKDKGYKELDKEFSEYTYKELNTIAGEYKTTEEGLLKPMLAKQADSIANKKVFDKVYYGSRKINGVRCLIYYKDNEIHTHSRGSISYDFVLDHILSHPLLIKLFKANPNLILDGEIYKFGWTLNKISGICRSQKTAYDGEPLEFYMYDIVDVDLSFVERLKKLIQIKKLLRLTFDPERDWNDGDLKIQIVPQIRVSGFDNMMYLHDKYISEGWEGLVVRLASAKYGPGKRTNDMIKIKVYKDSEYKIVGLKEGLRPEDMCFTMETENGQQFNAKPIGDREQKQWYRDNINNIIGKMATLKYFEMSGKEGSEVPQQPVLLSIRDYE
jgi:hypothetical protein